MLLIMGGCMSVAGKVRTRSCYYIEQDVTNNGRLYECCGQGEDEIVLLYRTGCY